MTAGLLGYVQEQRSQ